MVQTLRGDYILNRGGLAFAAILCACGGGATSVESARGEIEAVTRRWEASLLAGRPDLAVPDVFTSDAVRLPSGEPSVRGQANIAVALAGSAPLSEASFSIADLEVDGSLAFANGTYRVRTNDNVELNGKFLEVWKRTTSGWRIHRVMWDSDAIQGEAR